MTEQKNTLPIKLGNKFIAGKPTNTASARDLHQYLEVGQDFSNWIKRRIEEYGFEQNKDYLKLSAKFSDSETKGIGGKSRIEYYLSFDMAKELAMVEKNAKGRQVRQYFIECERQYREKQLQRQAEKPQLPMMGDNRQYLMVMQNGKILHMIDVPFDAFVLKREEMPEVLDEYGEKVIKTKDLANFASALRTLTQRWNRIAKATKRAELRV